MKTSDTQILVSLLKEIRSASENRLVSVREIPLSPMFTERNIHSEDRVIIMSFLKDNILQHTGVKAGLKYRWQADIDDLEQIAKDIIDYSITFRENNLKVKTVKKVIVNAEKKNNLTSRIIERNVGSKGIILYNNRLHEAYVSKVTKYPMDKPSYEVLITIDSQNVLLADQMIFPDIAAICQFLEKTYRKFDPEGYIISEETFLSENSKSEPEKAAQMAIA
ncbi:MAG: hypothetical protein AB9834_09750 [Lentimicrobium sp.]